MPGFGQQMAALINDQVDAGQSVSAKMGTVLSRETASARAIVSFDGSSGVGQPVKCFETVICDVGDRVGLLKIEGDWIIAGNYTLRTLCDEFMSIQYTSTTTTSSATFVDMPTGTSLPIVKVKDATNLRIFMTCSLSATTTSVLFTIGANITNADGSISSDVNCIVRAFNPASTHQDWSGGTVTSLSLPAGSYTITGRWLKRSGTGNLSVNTDDGVTIAVKEVV
jgi:hypothetical protein